MSPSRRLRPTDRRTFLTRTGGCLAHLALLDGLGWLPGELFAADVGTRIVRDDPWGRLEEVADGVWALVSTPLEDRLTLCNGGIIAGGDGVLMVEAFASAEGAVWMAEEARRLTGRWPDHVVVTHYHGDHSAGLPGLHGDALRPLLHMTPTTQELTRARAQAGEAEALLEALRRVTLLLSADTTRIDLGGRQVRLVPRVGHTASDVTVEIDDPAVVFCGDLVWHRFFPNFMDARPAALSASVRALPRSAETTYVPGHGPLADAGDFALYVDFLDAVEAQARAAFGAGRTVDEAAAAFVLPSPFDEWYRFSPRYPRQALEAWYGELDGTP